MKNETNYRKSNQQSTSTCKQRNVGVQVVYSTKEYISPNIAATFNLELYEYPKYFVIPHTIISLSILCSIILYLSLQDINQENSLKYGLLAISVSFCCFGCVYLPDSIVRRPHPIFWRFIQSCAILYMFFLAFLLFQPTPENSRNLLKIFDDKLGVPLVAKSYAENCNIVKSTFPYIDLTNIYDSIDFFMTAHLVGWFVKMLIVRDVYLCWFLSIFFEIMEITFRHWLPNFWECWWDHAILDVFGCNALGIFLGHMVVHYFQMKNFKWFTYTQGAPYEISKEYSIKNIFNLFHPSTLSKHDWKIFSSFDRFRAVLWYIFFINMVDLSHFFIKMVLWIPADHNILFVRINFWACFAVVCTREYYEYVTNDTYKAVRFGHFNWLAHLVIFFEWMIIIKNRGDYFANPFPNEVLIFWGIVLIVLIAISIYLIRKEYCSGIKHKGKKIDLVEPDLTIEDFDPTKEIILM